MGLLCVQEVECEDIQGCEVSISVRCNDDSCLPPLDPVITYFTIPILPCVCVCVCVCARACACACACACVCVVVYTHSPTLVQYQLADMLCLFDS